jgi:acetoacetate decarboxylase
MATAERGTLESAEGGPAGRGCEKSAEGGSGARRDVPFRRRAERQQKDDQHRKHADARPQPLQHEVTAVDLPVIGELPVELSGRYLRNGPNPLTEPDGPKMWSQNLVAIYETDPEIIAAVLPRPFEPAEPHVRVNMACVDMPGLAEPLEAGTFSVKCRHGDLEGYYDLLMIMSAETAVLGGRETFGEPKKIGRVSLRHEGGDVVGVMSRRGVDIVEVRGTVAETLEPGPVSERFAFYFKFLLYPQGGGFDHDPTLVHVRRTQEDRMLERITGDVILRDSPFDPVADLPVRDIVSILYSENHQTQTGVIVGTVPGEWVWPFRHQRYDNLIARLQPA